jgi:hypothetical protein
MLNFGPDFWPLFWAIMGGAAVLTVALSLLIATITPASFRPRRRHPALAPVGPAGRQAGHDDQAHPETKAA